MARHDVWSDGLEEALAAPFPAAAHKIIKKGGAEKRVG